MAEIECRIGRVSKINYKDGTYEVTYFDRGQSVTRQISAMSNGEYKMPGIGQVVSVSHSGNGLAAGVTVGSVWNETNKPVEGFEGLYRKEYSLKKGQAYDRYDANEGIFTHYADKRTGRNCKGEIYDEAKGPISVIAGDQIQMRSEKASLGLMAAKGVGISAGEALNVEAGTFASLEVGTDASLVVAGDTTIEATGKVKAKYKDKMTRKYEGDIEDTVTAKVTKTITGEVTLHINGATISISTAGDITISSPTKITMDAPEVNLTGGTGDVKVDSVSLTTHTHTAGGSGPPQK